MCLDSGYAHKCHISQGIPYNTTSFSNIHLSNTGDYPLTSTQFGTWLAAPLIATRILLAGTTASLVAIKNASLNCQQAACGEYPVTLPCGSTIRSIPASWKFENKLQTMFAFYGQHRIHGKWRHRAASLGKCYSPSNMIGQTGQNLTTVHISLFSARTSMVYRSGANCIANPPKYHLPVGATIFNL